MTCTEESIAFEDLCLRRYIFHPDAGVPIRGAAFHFHGQGDFARRYGEILEPFLQKGIACVATDLPGHGHSGGRRGRVPGFEIVDRIAASNLDRCRELAGDSAPLGILGHSAGGLMAIREILQNPDLYSFSWISSPLVRPDAARHPVLIRLARLGARVLPGLTISTGVTPARCSRQSLVSEQHRDAGLTHSRVSIGWGYAMIKAARCMREELPDSPPRFPLLITQGLRDTVCPPEYLDDLLGKASLPLLTLRTFPEALHEPFSDDTREELFPEISAWLENESIV